MRFEEVILTPLFRQQLLIRFRGYFSERGPWQSEVLICENIFQRCSFVVVAEDDEMR